REMILAMDDTLPVTVMSKNQLMSLYYNMVDKTKQPVIDIKNSNQQLHKNDLTNQMKTQTSTKADVLFDELPKTSFPEPIYIDGDGIEKGGRLILTIKLNSKLKPYFKNGEISLTVVRRKKPSEFGHTHYVVINQNEWPKNTPFSRNFLTIAK